MLNFAHLQQRHDVAEGGQNLTLRSMGNFFIRRLIELCEISAPVGAFLLKTSRQT